MASDNPTPDTNDSNDDVHLLVTDDVDQPIAPNPDYEFDHDENPGLATAHFSELVNQYPLLMHALQAAVETDESLTGSTVHQYVDADAVDRSEIQKALWQLERIDVLATGDYNKYITRTSSEIYMAWYSIATEPFEDDSIATAIDLREFTLRRLLVFEMLIRRAPIGGFTLQELNEYWGIPVTDAAEAIKWLFNHDLVVANADETYSVNTDNRNAKKFGKMRSSLVSYGGATPNGGLDVSVEMDS